jgi:UDP-2,4-diacetamido-2,4,6-trideoxy-beta-L-altropyranose hydrolase
MATSSVSYPLCRGSVEMPARERGVTKPLLVVRADGGPSIGAGHVMRTLALASRFQEGGWSVGFAATEETFASVAALSGWPLERLVLGSDATGESEAMRRRWPDGADVLIVDHYGRDVALERACRGWARRIVVIDDLADRPHDADILVDVANPPEAYRGLVPEACEILTGANYAIVNAAFRAARPRALARRNKAAVERVQISFGQVDAPNATQTTLAALASVGFAGDVDAVLGHAAPHLDAIRAAAGARTRLHIDANDMPSLMAEADLAIGAGGVTALERCCLGLPSVLVTVADNQRGIAAMLKASGASVDAGDVDAGLERRLAEKLAPLFADGSRRAAMADAGQKLVDGLGVERIVLAALGSVPAKDGSAVRLRPANAADEDWLLQLQSQPEVRRYSNDPTPPALEGHREWLAHTLADSSRLLMIATVDGVPAGMLRLDRQAHGERVNIAVDSRYHRRGIGAAILALAALLRPGYALDAEVLPGNQASQALFAAAGYQKVGERLFRRKLV